VQGLHPLAGTLFSWGTMRPSVYSAIDGIRVLAVAAACGRASGSLTASAASELKWTAPGDSQGAGVTIAQGETKKLESGGSDGANLWLYVKRTGSDDLSGTAIVTGTGLAGAYELLATLDTDIATAQAAMAASTGDNRVQRQTIDALYKRRDQLMKALAREDGRAAGAGKSDLRGNF